MVRVLAQFFCPRGRSFAVSLCPVGGGGEGEWVRLAIDLYILKHFSAFLRKIELYTFRMDSGRLGQFFQHSCCKTKLDIEEFKHRISFLSN